ncbi:methyl-accepting chemotaxis protein [Cohnella cholangitidis]|uniref:CBS domain-containing protein n=1 Tax=Cohnella cholangitidis TaxID=2598458 RepID=A0A7G5BUU2_9BACL|nr:methyl-accepting chemotaxis protein [Cohnella cholangitidis]QMV40726.1 CBS domain-containing protein [Cohnella cholangitidis]
MAIATVLTRTINERQTEVQKSESHPIRKADPAITEIFQPIIVKDWMKSCPVISPTMHSDDLVNLFRRKKQFECVAVCDDTHRPVGLIMRDRFFQLIGSLYGMSLFGHKPISGHMEPSPLIAELSIDPQELIDRALSRSEETFYDAVLLTDNGKFVGILTMNDLLNVSRLLQREAVSRQIRTIRDTESMIVSIHDSVERVNEATSDTQACSERIGEIADQGREELGEMLQLFKIWSSNAAKQEKAVVQLTERTSAAEGIIRLIADLADQCNLLAVNATIEAARAGEHGKGFGVVAGEIRTLADQTKQSATQISGLLRSMSEAVLSATSLVGEGKKGADKGFLQVKKTEDTFAQLWSSSELNQEAASKLMEASREASDRSTEVRMEFQKLVQQMNS